ncbi:MAG TPA: HlyD family efflux transporter periplasmic adaptor subunit [Caulobacteraceae bacterium]|jgi:membrane fusion protein (multidrug efflux system)|nr:HlyD family efflux transporter periplasmic adaptor subunit [Caulobacteraceae bacterium]
MDARTAPAPGETITPFPPLAGVPQAQTKPPSRRKSLFILLGAAVALAAALALGDWLLVASHHQTTDNAYVQADVAQVTPLVSGAVISAPVGDTRFVKKGEVLVVIDPADYRLALAQAEAALGQAQRKVAGYFADVDASAAVTTARGADIARARAQADSARADLERARTDLARRQALAPAGAVSGDELTSVQNRFDQAKAALVAAQAAVTQAQASQAAAAGQQRAAAVLVNGAGVSDNPEVAAAQARLAQARLDLERTVIRAPVDGVIAKNAVEIGQRVQAGAPLMTVVPIQRAYVDANFKEVQLKKVRLGQPVTLTSDLYGGGVKFHGRVTGLAGGTGSAFAVIPAQNATGNWIKVVQRLPVRIALDPAELARHPLRVGLSMNVDIDTNR